MSFLNHPQQVWWRKALFEIHLWTGIGLGLYLFVIGVTGAALVFREELEPMLASHAAAVSPSEERLTFDELRTRLERDFPGHHVDWLFVPDQATKPVEAWIEKDHSSRIVLVDPTDGRVLEEKRRAATFFGFLQELHFHLLGGELGGKINGIGAMFLFLMCFTGIILWWPGGKNWRRSLTVNTKAKWKRVNWDLHSAVGFWTVAFVAMWAFTGVYFFYPEPFRAAVNALWPLSQRERPRPNPLPGGAPLASIDGMIYEAERLIPAAKTTWVRPPNREGFPTLVYRERADGETVYAYFDSASGALARIDYPENRTTGDTIIRWFGRLHFGNFARGTTWNTWVKGLWLVMGLAPAALFVTGFLMWWNRVLSKKWAKVKRPQTNVQQHATA